MKSRALERTSGTPDGSAKWTKRVILGGLGTAGASIALAALASAAFANAANPTSGTGDPLQDVPGGVLVHLHGSWSWGELTGTKTSPQNKCDGRYGVGWSVDWWGMNGTTATTPGKGPTTATLVSVPTKTTPPTNLGLGQVSVGGTWTVKGTGQVFHTSAQYNGFEADLCPANNPDIHLDGNGAPSGTWSASAVYPSRAAIPAQVCVNFYDPHGQEGQWSTSNNDALASQNNDNSITTNDFNPANPKYCFSPTPDTVAINVVKSNNAGGGAFAHANTAGSSSENVTFKVDIQNNQSTVPVTISSVTDSIVGGNNVPNIVCNTAQNGTGHNVVGDVIPVGGSETCYFTVNNYLATYLAAGQSAVTDDVVVNVTSTAGPAHGDDTSVVNAPNPNPTLASHIYRCDTNQLIGGGNLQVKNAAGTVLANVADFPATQEPAGNYSVTATPPAGFVLVPCHLNGDNYGGQSTLTATLPPSQVLDFYVLPAPGVKVTKDGPATGTAGSTGDYTITLSNTSSQVAVAGPTDFFDQLPAGETFLSARQVDANGNNVVPSQISCGPVVGNASLVKCTYSGNLAPSASVKVDVTIQWASNVDGQVLTDCAGTTAANAANGAPDPKNQCVPTRFGNPGVLVHKDGPPTGTLNGQGTYTITATNFGDAASVAQTWTDTLPDGEVFDAQHSTATCTQAGNVLTCNVPALAKHGDPGDTISYSVRVTYTKAGLLTDCATINGQLVPSCVSTRVPTPSISIVKTNDANGDGVFHDSETANNPGDAVTFRAVVTNNSDATIVVDTLTDAFNGSTVDLAQSCPALIGAVMAPGDQLTCTFTLQNYAPAAGTSLTNTITVGGHEPNSGTPVTDTDTSTVTTKNPPQLAPDVAIIKTADKDSVKVGNTLTYTLAVTNVGQGPTTGDVIVTDAVPSGLDLVSVDGGSAWKCDTNGNAFSCTYQNGVLNPGDAAPLITVVTTVNDTAVGAVINTGVVDTPGDVNPANNRSTVKTPVIKVLGTKTVKPTTPTTPTVLPFTGDRTAAMLPVGLAAILAGLLLMVAGRRRRRTA